MSLAKDCRSFDRRIDVIHVEFKKEKKYGQTQHV